MNESPISRILEWRKNNPDHNLKRLEGLRASKKAKLAAIRVSQDPVYRKKRSEAMINHPKMRKGIKHPSCKEWHIKSPCGKIYNFINLDKFIRENYNLFNESDVAWRKHPSRASYLCKAYSGLSAVRCGSVGTWKGWTWDKTYCID